jgi:hypothetical protein
VTVVSLVSMYAELIADLNTLTASWRGARWVGLFQNDWTPVRSSTISEVQPCEFAGYDGLHQLAGWSAAVLFGDSAVTYAALQQWTYTGGGPGGYVVGYYVVDQGGALQWAERNPAGSVALVVTGDTFPVTAAYALRSRYPTE